MKKQQFRIVNKRKGKLDITAANLHKVVGNQVPAVNPPPIDDNNDVTDYRSEYEADTFIYSGFHLNNIIVIKRTKDNTEENAQNLTDLEVDWNNRLTLTYL